MAEGGVRPDYSGGEHPCKLCYVRAITRRALITHYLRKHKKGLDYGSDWPRDLDEADYQKRMVKLKRGRKNSYEVVPDVSLCPVPCQVFMNVTQKPYQVVSSQGA